MNSAQEAKLDRVAEELARQGARMEAVAGALEESRLDRQQLAVKVRAVELRMARLQGISGLVGAALTAAIIWLKGA
jgi:hypothetical protein